MIKKNKSQKIITQEDTQKVQKTKKNKNKKKKKQSAVSDKSNKTNDDQKQTRASSKHQKSSVTPIKQQKQQLKALKQRLEKQALLQQYNQLQNDGKLQVNLQRCVKVNSTLQQLTINLLYNMIMKQMLIYDGLKLARRQRFTPSEYFYTDYTNKLLLLLKLLETSPTKYKKFKNLIESQVRRVQGLILLSLNDIQEETTNSQCQIKFTFNNLLKQQTFDMLEIIIENLHDFKIDCLNKIPSKIRTYQLNSHHFILFILISLTLFQFFIK